jgi:hypothetical protein
MSGPQQSIKGVRIGQVSLPAPPAQSAPAEEIADPTRPRRVLEYFLARRGLLEELKRDALTRSNVCDADPYLLRAAKHHGEQTERDCPMCAKSQLVHVIYTFGGDLGYFSGRVHNSSELAQMAHSYGNFKVYVVEACLRCEWNHLYISYELGDGIPRKPPGKPRDVLD